MSDFTVNPATVAAQARDLSPLDPAFTLHSSLMFADLVVSLELDILTCTDECSKMDSELREAAALERLFTREQLVRCGTESLKLTESQVCAIVADALLGV